LVLYGVGVILMITFLPDGLVALRGASRSKPHAGPSDAAPEAGATPHASRDLLFAQPARRRRRAIRLIAVAGVTMRFGGLSALDGVSLDVARGSVHAVIGPNGSGKTTFLNVSSGAYAAQARLGAAGRRRS